MKKILTVALFFLFVFGGPGFAEDSKSELTQVMTKMQEAYDELHETIRDDSKKVENLARVEQLIADINRAKELEPAAMAHLEGSDRDAFLEGYKKALGAMVADAEELKALVEKDADPEARFQQLKKVYDHQGAGHDNFQD